jgi:hypothetical protein
MSERRHPLSGFALALAVVLTVGCSESLEVVTTTTSEPRPPIPEGVLVAVPQQNREDPAKNQFQVKIMNKSDDRFRVTSVQLVWGGFTTERVPKDSIVVAGQSLDLPVPFPGARCVGDGTKAKMPPLETAGVRLGLDDGTEREVPVVDHWFVLRSLYLDDCRRNRIEALVTIEWAELERVEFDGRPVTAGVLRLTRRESTDPVTVTFVSGTIPYNVEFPTVADGEPLVTLAVGESVAEVPMRFTEARCDPHALAEVKQPFKFIAQVDLGDGVLVPYIIIPARESWTPIRSTANEGCLVAGKIVELGETTPTTSVAG